MIWRRVMAEHGFTGIFKSMCSFFGGMKPVSGISPFLYLLLPVLIVLIAVIGGMVRILREYERAVVFTVGRFDKVKGPRLVLFFPFIQHRWCASICTFK